MPTTPLSRLAAGAGLSLVMGWAGLVTADTLGEPEGRVVLTITGSIETTNTDTGAAEFDMQMLQSLPMVTVETSTPWTEGVVTFEGVTGEALMMLVGGEGGAVAAVALNDYVSEIPFDEFAGGDVFVAYHQDGRRISVRERGPLWVLYPFDERPEYDDQTHYARSVWQLRRLDVR